MFDKRFLDELRSRLTLSEIIGKRLKLSRAGREYKACCPFHNEKTPSFYINDAKGFFHCFGCGAHGDVVTFRMRHDNLTFMEAIETLCLDAGIPVPVSDPKANEKYDEIQRLQQVMENVTKWYEAQLKHPPNGFALRYLRERGINDDMIHQFRIGYAPNNWDSLREAMIAKEIALADLVTLGLLRHSTREDKAHQKPYSFFRGRIIFPVTDAKGRVIAFGGRHLDEAFSGQTLTEKPPKYINSSEHILFNKSQVLYGLARARMMISSQSPLLLAEGYMDVVSLVQSGFTTAVAPLGTALTEEHMQLAWKVSPSDSPPILCFDGDKAGQAAAYRAIDRLLPHLTAQRTLRVAFLPEGEDPDSLIRQHGAQALQRVLTEAIGVFDTLWKQYSSQTPATAEGRAHLEATLGTQIARVKDSILQQSYRLSLKNRLFEWGRLHSNAAPSKGKNSIARTTQAPSLPVKKMDTNQDITSWNLCLVVLINHPFLLERFAETLSETPAPTAELDQIREALISFYHLHKKSEIFTTEELKKFLSSRELNPILATLNHQSIISRFGFARPNASADQALEGWKDVWTRMQRKNVTHDKNQLLQTIKTHQLDEDIHRLMMLNEQEKSLNLDDNF